MEDRLTLPCPVVVEGKYDKNKLSRVIDSPVITLDGFSVFNNPQKRKLLARISEGGVIILTDSDRAGHFIRSRLRSCLNPEKTVHLYIPRVKGREKRKTCDSADGLLGVEGMEDKLLYDLLLPYASGIVRRGAGLSQLDFWRDGLSGSDFSAERRTRMASLLGLPEGLSSKALLEAINLAVEREEYEKALSEVNDN